VTGSGHDAKWWKHFTAAPPELQRAMYATLKAREILELRAHLGTDDKSALAAYEQRLEEREQTELRIRKALGRDQPRSPGSQQLAMAHETGRGVSPDLHDNRRSPSASGADRYW